MDLESAFGLSKAAVNKQYLSNINGAAMMATSERSSHVTKALLSHTHTNKKLIPAARGSGAQPALSPLGSSFQRPGWAGLPWDSGT